MTFEQYWTILLKRWRLIVMCCLLVGAGAAFGSRLTTRLYQSTALVQVVVGLGSNLSAYDSLLASDQLVQTEALLATSDPVLREVASHYKGLTVEQLAQEVTATPKFNTQLFEIDVVDPSPTRAAALANDVAQTLIKQQLDLTQESNLLVVQAAMPNPSPVQPNTRLNTGVGLLTGLLLGMLLAALLELLDTQVRAPEALTQLLNWPVLATIWRVNPNEDVVNPTGHNTNVEAFRILRTNIGFSTIDKPLQTLVVTSALDRDGKSIIAANLAIFMAKAGKTTLLIDADMRRPTLQQTFGLSADAMGLSNAILAFSATTTDPESSSHNFLTPATPAPSSTTPVITQISLDPFVYAVDIPNLYIIPSGPLPPNPPELLDSKAMQYLFKALGNCGAEVVIFDTPSLLGLSDASILASKADGTLVVIDITRAKGRNLKQLKALMGYAGANVLGCVVNKQHLNRHDTAYSYYYATDEQNSGGNHSMNNVNSLPESPVTPVVPKQPEAQSRSDPVEQDYSGSHSTNNPNSSDVSDQTIKLPRYYRRKDKQREDE